MSVSLGYIIHKYHWNAQKQSAFLQGRGKADSNPVSNDMIDIDLDLLLCFPGGSEVKNLPAVCETWVRSLGRENPLEKEMAIQYSCLENSMDRGAWQATVHGIAESDTTERVTLLLSFKDRLELKAALDS